MQKRVNWGRSSDGQIESTCGCFLIGGIFIDSDRSQGSTLDIQDRGEVFGGIGYTQAQCKERAEDIARWIEDTTTEQRVIILKAELEKARTALWLARRRDLRSELAGDVEALEAELAKELG